ncbi:MAG TPA: AAA family ATPase [Solirubrobacterales bacterium]|jgi:DNA-binding CsgD family transcriptional regulator|nr:AAA family ATPase [Solirubrobacterales bacterium]
MDLVERERELDALTALLDGLAEGRARTALIEGPAGIGKTRLLSTLKVAAGERGVRVLNARGSELEREFPFGVVRQLFEPALREAPNRTELFEGAAEIAGSVFGAPGEELGGSDASFAVLHGLYWLTLDLAGEEPLLLAVDDIQWCDRPSLRLLAYLVRRLEGQPLLIAATLRSAEPGTDTALLAEIAGDPLTDRILPGPLSRAAVPTLIERRLGGTPEQAFTAACHDATGGNPLLLDELLKGLAAEGIEPRAERAGVVRDLGPRAVSRAVLLRLARLSDADVAVARALAVLGEGAELTEIAALAGLGEAAVASATGELARVEILRPEPPLGFVHPLVRDAVYNDLPPGQRELEHNRAARLLREGDASPERIAAHLLRVPPLGEDWVADLLVDAGRTAAEQGGAENAVAYLKRALEEPLPPARRTAVLYELGQREMDVRGDEAVDHLREAYAGLADPEERGWAGYALARTLMFTRREVEAAELAREVSGELPPGFDDLARALEAIELQTVFFGHPAVAELERTVPYRDGVPGDGPGSKMLTAVTAYTWANAGGDADRCAALAREALADETLFSIDNGLFWVTAVVVLIYADRGDTGDIWEEARAVAHRRGSLFTVLTIDLWRGFDLLRRGDLEQAQESIEAGLEEMVLWSGSEAGMVVEWPTAFLGEIHTERGDLDAAERVLDRGHPADRTGDGPNFWRKSKIELLLARGRAEEALPLCDLYESKLGTMNNPGPAPWRSLRAEVLDRLGRREEALSLAAEEVEAARDWGGHQAIGRALRVLGTLQHEDGIEHLREAVAVLERSTARLEQAKALLALGTALRLARQPSEAREPLRRALDVGSACSADALVERARGELRAAGVRPRREALGGVESLTPSERRVAGMAAEELTNREIAQALFVTPKTVEVHLSNAYRKLDIRSRRELAGALT